MEKMKIPERVNRWIFFGGKRICIRWNKYTWLICVKFTTENPQSSHHQMYLSIWYLYWDALGMTKKYGDSYTPHVDIDINIHIYTVYLYMRMCVYLSNTCKVIHNLCNIYIYIHHYTPVTELHWGFHSSRSEWRFLVAVRPSIMGTLAALQRGIVSAPTDAVSPREGPRGSLPASGPTVRRFQQNHGDFIVIWWLFHRD